MPACRRGAQELLYAGPLFIHQFSPMWIDLRGIQDAFMRDHGLDYFESSRRATHVQQAYARANPLLVTGLRRAGFRNGWLA